MFTLSRKDEVRLKFRHYYNNKNVNISVTQSKTASIENPIELETTKQTRVFTGLFQSNPINISTYIYIRQFYPKCDSMRLLELSLFLVGLKFSSPDWLILESAGRLRRQFMRCPTKSRDQHRRMTEALWRGFRDLEVLYGLVSNLLLSLDSVGGLISCMHRVLRTDPISS